jgi:histidyl-tRNA synthetase
VGISLGVERICEVLTTEGLKLSETKTRAFVAVADSNLMDKAVHLAQALRTAGVNVQIDLMVRSLKNQLEYVNKVKIPFVIFVGEKELKSGKYTVKDMAKRQQGEFTLEKIVKVLGG